MSAPKPFALPAPVKATEIPLRRESAGARDRGPNLYLQAQPGFPKGWLMKSFEDGEWYDQSVQGTWAEVKLTKGANKGKTVEKMTGDAMEATRQLREAATTLGIGVSIKYFPEYYKGGAKKGEEIPGRVLLKYIGIPRKQPRTANGGATE